MAIMPERDNAAVRWLYDRVTVWDYKAEVRTAIVFISKDISSKDK